MPDAAAAAMDGRSRDNFGGFDVYRIPYDLDPLWDDGCEGTDVWPDSYGKQVLILLSDTGSAYICPERMDNKWRIFMGPGGRAWKLLGWPANEEDNAYESVDAGAQAAEILSCALRSSPEMGPTVRSMVDGSFFNSNPGLPIMLRGMEIALSRESWRKWRLVADSGRLELSCGSKKYVVDEVPIAASWEEYCDVDPEWNVVACERDNNVYRFLAEDMKEVTELLATKLLHANGAERVAVEIALMAFERGWANVQEIERFEAACREALSR